MKITITNSDNEQLINLVIFRLVLWLRFRFQYHQKMFDADKHLPSSSLSWHQVSLLASMTLHMIVVDRLCDTMRSCSWSDGFLPISTILPASFFSNRKVLISSDNFTIHIVAVLLLYRSFSSSNQTSCNWFSKASIYASWSPICTFNANISLDWLILTKNYDKFLYKFICSRCSSVSERNKI